MTVYVDDMRRYATVRRLRACWSHLFADTHEELAEFAAGLGLRPEWIQHAGTHREHFDLVESQRRRAIDFGAVPISYPRETGDLMRRKRATAHDPASGPAPAPGAPGGAGVDAGTGEAG